VISSYPRTGGRGSRALLVRPSIRPVDVT
jgi:hypothetical protein